MRKLLVFSLLIIVFLIFAVNNVLAQGMQFDGFLESYYSIKLKDDHDFIGERSRFRLNLRNSSDNMYMFASLNGVSNGIIEDDELEVEIHEAYLEYTRPLWDVKIGRQIYSWGKADGVRITDVLSPCDYSEYITRDFDEIRIPVDSVKYRYLFPMADLELVWIPTFTEPVYPEDEDNPWYVSRQDNITINPAEEVEDELGNSELAARLSFYLNGIDFSFSTAYLWDDEAVYHKTGTTFTPEYHRLRFYGLDLSKPVNDFVIRFESAYYQGKYFSADSYGLLERDYVHSLAGLDWYPGNNWTVTTQYINKHIFDYEDEIEEDESQDTLTLSISKKLFREVLEVKNMVYYEPDEQDGFNRISIDYAVNDNFHFLTGIDYFFGNEGEFANYDDNDSLWVKVKYDF
ncbi:DUF1302 family protein [Halocella sp. SP3-1]|uniref:DUF1302 family protein n=1 Tax=Halocella sp. SP3-1 TaxID=2382161 RepID=UPI000F74E00F|nr:DUF1302 family protein [Halocella sp. SP3-1]AZO95983.1 hypothetical protein D7D81_16060 [Halocella sp. SP3-1]